jgi:hypothetical protein
MSNTKRNPSTLSFGPYNNAAEALYCCQRFINDGFTGDDARTMGIVWAEPAGTAVLRAPALDRDDQIGASLLVQWHGPVKPVQPAPPTVGFWQTIEDTVSSAYQKIGAQLHEASSRLDQTDAYIKQNFGAAAPFVEFISGVDTAMAERGAWRYAKKELEEHPKVADVLSTTLDAVGVVTGIIAIVVLAPAIGTVAGAVALTGALVATAASGALLYADGVDTLHLVIQDDKAAADEWENTDFFRRTQLLAPLLALPDAVRGGAGVAREVGEATDAFREAQEGAAVAAAKSDLAAGRVADQEAANAAKQKVYKGDKQKLQQLTTAQKNATKRLVKASRVAEQKKQALRTAILKSLRNDAPGLASTAVGTGIYTGHLPDMMKQYRQNQQAKANQPASPVQRLVPPAANNAGGQMSHYLSFGIVASSQLRTPDKK